MATRVVSSPALPEPLLPIADLDALLRATEYLADQMAGPWAALIAPREYRHDIGLAWHELSKRLGTAP